MPAEQRARELTVVAARAAAQKKGSDIVALDVSGRMPLADVFLLVTGESERQVTAIVDAVEEALHGYGVKAVRKEGAGEARWVLLDYGDLIVHVQHEQDREYYALERLWKDCPVVELPAEVTSGPADGEPSGQE